MASTLSPSLPANTPSSSNALPLPVVWTQRIHDVYLTANVLEPQSVFVEFHATEVLIRCQQHVGDEQKQYQLSLSLFAPIDVPRCEYIVLTRGIRLKLKKAAPSSGRPAFWTRITEQKVKLAHVTVDWDTWKDEDELIEADDEATQGAAFSEMMGFRMANGTTISGGGDPNVIAELQRTLLAAKKS
ncbi:Hypothetical protein, putative [Bodo saltans]|uniref:p23-like protein n=1 Tax=Bodo saltans TaxID=75058 RepID=A0A0S4JQC8_BODSA|eukprot:CUG91254.1 Hypothetical protein, putative [Bodo saltans]